MLIYLNRAFARAPIGAPISLRPLIVLSIITYLFAIVCIGQLRQERHHERMGGAPGVDASPIMSGELEEKDGDGDEDEDSLAEDKTAHLVKRSEVQVPVKPDIKVRSFAGSPAAASNLIGVGGSRPVDEDDDDDDDREDDNDDDNDDDDEDRDERNGQGGKGQKSTGGSGGASQTQANQPAAPSLINRIMHFGGFGRAGGGGGGEQKNSQEPGNGARLFKLGLLLGR